MHVLHSSPILRAVVLKLLQPSFPPLLYKFSSSFVGFPAAGRLGPALLLGQEKVSLSLLLCSALLCSGLHCNKEQRKRSGSDRPAMALTRPRLKSVPGHLRQSIETVLNGRLISWSFGPATPPPPPPPPFHPGHLMHSISLLSLSSFLPFPVPSVDFLLLLRRDLLQQPTDRVGKSQLSLSLSLGIALQHCLALLSLA